MQSKELVKTHCPLSSRLQTSPFLPSNCQPIKDFMRYFDGLYVRWGRMTVPRVRGQKELWGQWWELVGAAAETQTC